MLARGSELYIFHSYSNSFDYQIVVTWEIDMASVGGAVQARNDDFSH